MNKLCACRPTLASAFWRRMRIGGTLLVLAFFSPLRAPAADTNATTNGASAAKTNDLTELPLEALMNLEIPKVYAASKVEQKTTEAPASITIVTSDEIKKYGYRTLSDLLASVPELYVSYDRNYAFLGFEGVSLGDFNSRVLLLVDGHRVNNNLTDGAAIGTDFILDIDMVDRVEVIHGPEAVLYGNNAFFGVINVITRQAKQLDGFETSFDYGALDTYKGRVSYGKQFTNGLNLALSGSIYESAGNSSLFYQQFDTPAQNNGIARNMDGDSYYSFFGSLGYNDFTLEAAFNHREKINPTAQYELTTFNDSSLRTVDERGYTELKYAHSFPDVVDVSARVYFDRYTHYAGFPQSLIVGNTVLFSSFSTENDVGEWWGTELQLNKTFWERLVMTLGAEYRDDFLQQSLVSGAAPIERERQSHGVYLQGDLALLTNLHLNAGIRYDQYSGFDAAYDPRLALIYNPFKGSTLKAIYATAFRDPNFTELSDPRFQNILPEEITRYELAYEQEITPQLRSSLSGFYNQMDHLIVFSSGNYTNLNAQTRGIEAALEGSWANGIRGRASYSFQETKNDTVSWQMPDSPEHLLKFDLSVPLVKDKVFAGAEFQYTSERGSLHNTTDAGGEPITVQGEEAGAYGILNLTLFSQNLIKHLELSASIYNLLDRRYEDPASLFHVQDVIQQDGRSFRVKLTYRF